jgi:lambda family phage portal protein
MKQVPRKRKVSIKPNIIDKTIEYFSPVRATRRLRARATMAIAGSYIGASKSRCSLKQWSPFGYDADSDTLLDLPTLRERSRDLIRNTPLATGAIKTKVSNIVGSGLKLQSRIDRGILNITDEAADSWETKTEREWRLFWESKDCDAARTLNGNAITKMAYRQTIENGDVFVILPRIKRRGFPYNLKIQLVEADRVTNSKYARDTENLAGGIEKDKYGAPVKYHILKQHPGANRRFAKGMEWQIVPAFGGELGLRNVIHLFSPDRPGQSRGVPDLAPVIEPLKQLDRYTEAELTAAVISGMFTVFVESESGDPTFDLSDMKDETGAKTTDDDYKLASGSIVGLAQGEKIHDSNPGRPNASFEPFVTAILRQIGVALELPFEVLTKSFMASYSASRGALLEAHKYFIAERVWLAENFNQIVYEIWMYEAVTLGRIAAPGFISDSVIRKAYLGSAWIGPAKGQIDEFKEVKASELRVNIGTSNLAIEADEMGRDWEKMHPQSVKEHNARKDAGLIVEKEKPINIEVEKNEDN